MRVGIIADVHGNLAALEAVLAALAAERVDRIVCLGDVAAVGPQPQEVIARLRSVSCPIVMGNADAWLLDPPPPGTGQDEDATRIEEIDRWCAEQLRAEDVAFLRTFRPVVELPLAGDAAILCYHGSPRSYDEVIKATTPDEELAPMLAGRRATVMAGGHWHFQMLRRYEDAVLLNPGSVGLAYDLLPGGETRVPARAEYALLSSQGTSLGIDLRRLPYDRDATVRAMFERGMPHAAWWSEGWR